MKLPTLLQQQNLCVTCTVCLSFLQVPRELWNRCVCTHPLQSSRGTAYTCTNTQTHLEIYSCQTTHILLVAVDLPGEASISYNLEEMFQHVHFTARSRERYSNEVKCSRTEFNHPELKRNYPMIFVPSRVQWFEQVRKSWTPQTHDLSSYIVPPGARWFKKVW